MQVRYETKVPIAHKKDGRTTIRRVPFVYDQQEWQPNSPLPALGYNIGFKDTSVLFELERAVVSQDGASALLKIKPVEPVYVEETIDDLISTGFYVLEKEFVGED